MLSPTDTIVAISSAQNEGLRGIVRLTGDQVQKVLQGLFADALSSDILECQDSKRFSLDLVTSLGPVPVDMFYWPTAQSYTRQPTAELHTFASQPVLQSILEQACEFDARLAKPGEFTLRAFLAGRIDLTQAEAVLGLIDANSDAEFQAALEQLGGNLAKPLQAARDSLIELLADVEAELDFVEEDIEFVSTARLIAAIENAGSQITAILEQIQARSQSETLPRVVLVGTPNVGKSSLFNGLSQEAAAIVSPVEGTTRDFLTTRIETESVAFELLDTAGVFEESNDVESEIDRIAQRQTILALETAELRLFCIDSSRPLNQWEKSRLTVVAENEMVLLTKCDLVPDPETLRILSERLGDPSLSQVVRCQTAGDSELQTLVAAIENRLASQQANNLTATTLVRCHTNLLAARQSLEQAMAVAHTDRELLATDLRLALNSIGEVAGTVYTDDILDRVFGKFCIGK